MYIWPGMTLWLPEFDERDQHAPGARGSRSAAPDRNRFLGGTWEGAVEAPSPDHSLTGSGSPLTRASASRVAAAVV